MRIFLVLFAAVALAAQTPEPSIRWLPITSSELEVNGLPWFAQNQGELYRLPLSLREVVRPPVWNLAQSPSGARLRFRTDATSLAIRVEYPSAPNMANMHAFGQTGVDLYVDGVYLTTVVADKDAAPGKLYERTLYNFAGRQRTEREITLYLSLYKPVKVLGVGFDKGATIARAKPFAQSKPVVFYGSRSPKGAVPVAPV